MPPGFAGGVFAAFACVQEPAKVDGLNLNFNLRSPDPSPPISTMSCPAVCMWNVARDRSLAGSRMGLLANASMPWAPPARQGAARRRRFPRPSLAVPVQVLSGVWRCHLACCLLVSAIWPQRSRAAETQASGRRPGYR